MYELIKNCKILTRKSVGTWPSSYEKRIYQAAVTQMLRNTGLECNSLFVGLVAVAQEAMSEKIVSMSVDVTGMGSVFRVLCRWEVGGTGYVWEGYR